MRRSAKSLPVRLAAAALMAATGLAVAAPAAGAFTTEKPGPAPVFFSSNRKDIGATQIHKLDRKTNEITRLTVAGTTDIDPTTNRDRTLVAFSATDNVLNAKSRIDIMSADGSGRHTVVADPGASLRDPSLSPGGDMIAYTRQAGTDQQVWVVNSDSTGRRQLTFEGTNRQPVWSPDGRLLAFVTERNGLNDIWMMNAYGQGAERVTFEGMGVADPAWSPNGRSIAYSWLDSSTNDSEIYWADAFSVNVTHRVSNHPGADRDPAWCADGRIIYTSTVDNNQKLFSATTSGTDTTLVTGSGSINQDADCGFPNFAG